MGHYELPVSGMQCIGCERIIEHELGQVKGVSRVSANRRAGVVECATTGSGQETVTETIEKLGYEVTA